MIDDNGDPWGKWLFWINLGSYNWKEYTIMKNWNDHGKVTGWLGGPLEMKMQFLQSPYGKDLKYYIYLGTARLQDDTWIYPLCEDYGVPPREEFYFLSPEGEQISEPGLETYYFYTDEGLLVETTTYIDDFLDQKLGIMIIFGSGMILTDYGVSDEILIEDPKPEYQKSTFDEELSKIEELKEQQKLAEKTQTPEKPPQKQEQEQQDTEEKENPLIYLVPVLAVVIIVVFIMLKEKR